ncbi:copper resistance system multicopper oxidase [Pinirhizobacter sp.]|uniref:copper resistance system multicopper oxidase n=1 Tax=Pinirhizobacter sp. TaxID=2950432 RepID=UPI002F42BF74
MNEKSKRPGGPHGGRRRFVQGLALGGVAMGLDLRGRLAVGAPAAARGELSGSQLVLDVGELPVDFTGRRRVATVVNGQLPGPLLRLREGQEVSILVRNHLAVPTSLHWHGLIVPADMDGVPGLSFDGIAPGGSYLYRFTVNQSGTYWYHAHSRFQEQTGLFGPIVIEPRADERYQADRDYVVLLADWTDEDPERVYATLKKQGDAYNYGKQTVGDFIRDARGEGVRPALAQRSMWNRMRMDRTDLADVSGATFTYLMNGVTPVGNWTCAFAAGEKIRLRFINGSSMSFFDVRIPGLAMTVVAADGQDIEPVTVDEFRFGAAETYDVIVQPDADRAYTIFAQSIDRSGYARGTLSPSPGMVAEVPAMDARPLLGMADMMGAMGTMAGMDGAHDMHGMPAAQAMTAMGHADMQRTGNPGVDMNVSMPRTNLDDPGVGLRANGRRVLTYADLHGVDSPISPGVEREITLRLTGNMERYMWSIDGVPYAKAPPISLRLGEHVRFTLVNDTMMHHPMHLHGMWSELEAPDGTYQARKHTVTVQPAQQVSYRVSADAQGRWAYHCHMLYHMEAGMFRAVVVA